MTPEALLSTVRRHGVVLSVVDGRIEFRGRPGALTAELRSGIARSKSAVVALLASEWWPAGRPKPNLLDLCRDYGVARVREAFAEVGVDPVLADPSWEALYAAAEWLEATR